MINKGRPSFVHIALIVLALVIGIFFRFEHLEKKLIWHDEVGTRLFVAGLKIDDWARVLYTGQAIDVEVIRSIHGHPKGALDTIRSLVRDDPQHPPLYYILAGIWVRAFGDDIATLRLLSALFSLLTFPAIHWLCRELFSSARIAWTGTALIAVSPFFVLYAQEAREYSLWFVLILFGNAALLRAIRLTVQGAVSPRLASAWALFTLITVMGLYTALATVSVMIASAAYILVREKFRATRITLMGAGALAASAILFLPWASALMMRWDAFQVSMSWSKVISIPNSSLLTILALNLSRPIVDFWPDRENISAAVGISLAAALTIWALVFLIRRAPLQTGALVLSLIFVPILMLLGPDLLFGGIRSVSARYITPSLIGVELALAYLFSAGDEGGRDRIRGVAFFLAIGVGIASCFHNSRQQVVWTKGISYHLPQVAAIINESQSPLVVGNRERHHPGNLLALSYLLKPGTRMQFLATEENYMLPRPFTVFLYSPTDQFRRALEERENVHTRLLMEDLHLQLWIVEPIGLPGGLNPIGLLPPVRRGP